MRITVSATQPPPYLLLPRTIFLRRPFTTQSFISTPTPSPRLQLPPLINLRHPPHHPVSYAYTNYPFLLTTTHHNPTPPLHYPVPNLYSSNHSPPPLLSLHIPTPPLRHPVPYPYATPSPPCSHIPTPHSTQPRCKQYFVTTPHPPLIEIYCTRLIKDNISWFTKYAHFTTNITNLIYRHVYFVLHKSL